MLRPLNFAPSKLHGEETREQVKIPTLSHKTREGWGNPFDLSIFFVRPSLLYSRPLLFRRFSCFLLFSTFSLILFYILGLFWLGGGLGKEGDDGSVVDVFGAVGSGPVGLAQGRAAVVVFGRDVGAAGEEEF